MSSSFLLSTAGSRYATHIISVCSIKFNMDECSLLKINQASLVANPGCISIQLVTFKSCQNHSMNDALFFFFLRQAAFVMHQHNSNLKTTKASQTIRMGNCLATNNAAIRDKRDSPYSKRTITLYFREEKHGYGVPQYFLEDLPGYQSSVKEKSPSSAYGLFRAEEDIAHTVIHWIHTGKYETLQNGSEQGNIYQQLEYKWSVHVYCVACVYGMPGLDTLAEEKMRVYEYAIDIGQILGIAREVFVLFEDNLPAGYEERLVRRLASAVKNDGERSTLNLFIRRLGGVPRFDKFVMDNLAALFLVEISELKERIRMEEFARECLREGKSVDEGESYCWNPFNDENGINSENDSNDGGNCSGRSSTDSNIVLSDPEESGPGYWVSSSDCDDPWSELESLTGEIESVDYWKD